MSFNHKNLINQVFDMHFVEGSSLEDSVLKTIESCADVYKSIQQEAQHIPEVAIKKLEQEISFLNLQIEEFEKNALYRLAETGCFQNYLDRIARYGYYPANDYVKSQVFDLKRQHKELTILERQDEIFGDIPTKNYTFKNVKTITVIENFLHIFAQRTQYPVAYMSKDKATRFYNNSCKRFDELVVLLNERQDALSAKTAQLNSLKEKTSLPESIEDFNEYNKLMQTFELCAGNALRSVLKEYVDYNPSLTAEAIRRSLKIANKENKNYRNLYIDKNIAKLVADVGNGLVKFNNKTEEKGM